MTTTATATVEYDVDYFIAKFEAIPDDRWRDDGEYTTTDGTCCAYGHCGVLQEGFEIDDPEPTALRNIIGDVIGINDGNHSAYPQPLPKARILAALHDIKAAT